MTPPDGVQTTLLTPWEITRHAERGCRAKEMPNRHIIKRNGTGSGGR